YGSWMRKTICVLTIKLFRRPVILHMHGGEFRKFYETKVGPLGRAGIRMILRLVDAIIALSPEWAEFYLKLAPKTRVTVIANAVAIPPALSDARLLHVERWRIVCVGRLAERKGTFDLLRAIGPLGDTVELWLAGDGDLDLARSLAHELGISQRVELLGWIDADARASLLSGAHIFALPSHAEGLPMALLEAMSYGLPVISTPVGGIPSLVENEVNGILIGPRDVEALTTAIKQLTEDPKRASRLGAAARKTIEERYDASAFRAKLHELHAEVAEKYLEQGRAAPAPRATARERS
ncbi:MAG TPA: glycosyltransferase family 4 protein, partial [Alphaproteobacteria bacterium]|nr:glycosyltransferase family 4 protein [Alphaproteobacteria bacterium]